MKIIIPSVQVPFIKGGAEIMTKGLMNSLQEYGHNVEIITFPFKFFPKEYLKQNMKIWQAQDFEHFNGHNIDKVIALQFPAYYVNHPNKSLWLMHQHRAVYDLYDEKNNLDDLKKMILIGDNKEFSNYKTIYTMSQNVSSRLKKYNSLESCPIYHPPQNENKFYCSDEVFDYVFYPSRLERLKRQEMLIKAMQYTKTPIKAIIAGTGSRLKEYQKLIENLNISYKVKLTGFISDEEKIEYYAHSLAVVFPPIDEDYGYITLEAMLSKKAVITCNDSGGTLEFVKNEETGFIIEPDPKKLAQKLDWVYNNKAKIKKMGQNSKEYYAFKDISWNNVVQKLLEC